MKTGNIMNKNLMITLRSSKQVIIEKLGTLKMSL